MEEERESEVQLQDEYRDEHELDETDVEIVEAVTEAIAEFVEANPDFEPT